MHIPKRPQSSCLESLELFPTAQERVLEGWAARSEGMRIRLVADPSCLTRRRAIPFVPRDAEQQKRRVGMEERVHYVSHARDALVRVYELARVACASLCELCVTSQRWLIY